MSTRLEQIERSNSIHNFGLTQKVSMVSKVRTKKENKEQDRAERAGRGEK